MKVPVLGYEKFLREGAPSNFQNYYVVRTLNLARRTESGYGPIRMLVYENGKVSDSQVIAYAGGIIPAQELVRKMYDHADSRKKTRVKNRFGSEDFNPEQPQGYLLYLNGDSECLDGSYSLRYSGQFVGVNIPALPANVGLCDNGRVEVIECNRYVRSDER